MVTDWIERICISIYHRVIEVISIYLFSWTHQSDSVPIINQFDISHLKIHIFWEGNKSIFLNLISSKMRNCLTRARFKCSVCKDCSSNSFNRVSNIVSEKQLGSFFTTGVSKCEIASKLVSCSDVVGYLVVQAVSTIRRANVHYSWFVNNSIVQNDISLLHSKESIVV